MDREALIFLHIPKTAGTTLNRIIERQYSPFAIFTMDPYRIRATAERLKRLPEGRRRRLRVVRGHLFYGIHEFLPQGATYITMLHEPLARTLSAYYFILPRKKEDAGREGLKNLRAIPRPGILKGSCRSSMCVARFLLNKIVSAI